MGTWTFVHCAKDAEQEIDERVEVARHGINHRIATN
jgi:hypothetical protein